MSPTRTEFHIEGMTCGGCEKSVGRTIRDVAGVADVAVDRTQNKAVVVWDSGLEAAARASATSTICAAVEAAGFSCRLS